MDKNDLVGSTDAVCTLPSLQVFVADCALPEVDCPCCTKCCDDSDADCNKDLLLISYNPTWEDRYEKSDYLSSISNGLGATLDNSKP